MFNRLIITILAKLNKDFHTTKTKKLKNFLSGGGKSLIINKLAERNFSKKIFSPLKR